MPQLRRVTHNVLSVMLSHPKSPAQRRVKRVVTAVSGALVTLAVMGLVVIVPVDSTPAVAATSTNSELTVAWDGDVSLAKDFQPERNPSSSGYAEFNDIKVSVSQTQGIVDQTVRVSVTGFSPTISATQSRDGVAADSAKNYIQAMQCWGDDPNAVDFNETCQWGGRVDGTGVGDSVIADNLGRVGPLDNDFAKPTTHDVPFRTANGREVSGKPRLVDGLAQYDMLNYFSSSSTNEVSAARIGTKGSGYFEFETQSSASAPQLGCGSAKHLRCWLVVVPRGTHFGGNGDECSGVRANQDPYDLFKKGQANVIQGGSPVNDQCDYFDNRIVVPLDFMPTGVTCAIGSTETRVVGSQLMTAAMSSWQPSLCSSVKSTFSFSTNSDVLARAQLIDTGLSSPNIAYSGNPVAAGELSTENQRTNFAKTTLSYVPVGVSSMVIGFVAESASGRQESLVFSPRLMAKYLTQSYPFLVPQSISSQGRNATHLGAANQKYTKPFQDPEFQVLNPTNYLQFQYVPALVLPGSKSDGIRQVWRWILADADARAFLSGAEDPWGMTVNPYYLPKGTAAATIPWYLSESRDYLETAVTRAVGLSNLDGTPRKLVDSPPDDFSKYDQTLMPLKLATERSRFDSIQFAPYSETFLAGARQTFRADSRAKTMWDPNSINAVGEKGDWKATGAQVPGQRFMITVTDSVSAQRWGISTASLTAPGTTVTAKTVPADVKSITMTPESMSKALAALTATSLDSVKQVDPSKVVAGGWPMTMVTYAGVNLTKAPVAARKTISAMLKQVTTTGQILGTAPGELPTGYLPLTDELKTQAVAAIATIDSFVPVTKTPAPKPAAASPVAPKAIAQDPFEAAADSGAAAAADPAVVAGVDELSTARTNASSTDPLLLSGLVIALVIGLAGLLIAPVLLRGRGFF
ncbi:hypothetical protein GCM10007382_15610 [Salinibacterium xinjiangense]|uniref:Uncharacterized protein n=1 Tax=Salinibacterium xinjiangense TaxID=386302 RepID=A0A2C8YAN8_9MICO|nr:hypothetical protein GCM10007382_15610 [Salinibacterium xinjiangense]SOE47313.1 hypothetical protein SAMN06296378_0210 [Salinibacterium xinjiangense]